MNNRPTILLLLAAALLLTACIDKPLADPDGSRVPIRLTTAITPTRAASAATQDEQMLAGERLYVWGTVAGDPYLTAWRLTADGAGSWSGQSSTPFWPGSPMTLWCVHGNFQPAPAEELTPQPASLSHVVRIDQSTAAGYAASDLLYCYETGVTPPAAPATAHSITLTHKLSKIIVKLVDAAGGADYTDAELARAEVRICGILPQITLNLDAAGTLDAPTGGAAPVTITPYQESAADPSYEAIIPAGQVKPAGLITVSLNGQLATLNPTAPADAASFEAGKKYTYTVTVSKTEMAVAVSSITNWTDYAGATPLNPEALKTIDVRRNPLWYVAKTNLETGGTAFATLNGTSQGYLWTWTNAMTLGYTASTTSYDGYALPATPKVVTNGEKGSTWHLPTHMEWVSIVPGTADFDIFSTSNYSGGTVVTEPACTFGYNTDTKYGKGNTTNPSTPVGTQFKSFWSTYVSNTTLRYAIRFLGTPYCSVWRYSYVDYGTTQGRLIINAKLIDQINPDETAKLSAMMTTITNASYDWSENEAAGSVERVFYATGYASSTQQHAPGTTFPNNYGGWWAATSYSDTQGWRLDANPMSQTHNLNVGASAKAGPRTVRLFRDGSARFSVGPGTTVQFSPGNLQAYISSGPTNTYVYAANNWRFAPNPWDYCDQNLATGQWEDHFSWVGKSATYNSYGLLSIGETNATYFGNDATELLKTDWGAVPGVVSALGAGWRTLTMGEWRYLVNRRTTPSGIRYAGATVNGVYGIILLPDDWSASYYPLASTNTASVGSTDNIISASVWNASLAPYGAVFLPAAGYRHGTSGGHSKGVRGLYWSSIAAPNKTDPITYTAYYLNFGNGVHPSSSHSRYYGCSVRLVR